MDDGSFTAFCWRCNRERKIVDWSPELLCRDCFLESMIDWPKSGLWSLEQWRTWCEVNNERMPELRDGLPIPNEENSD